jgi:hypothetical protein
MARMSDQELAVQAISEAQHILEEYLEPRHHNNEMLLDRLVEVANSAIEAGVQFRTVNVPQPELRVLSGPHAAGADLGAQRKRIPGGLAARHMPRRRCAEPSQSPRWPNRPAEINHGKNVAALL